MIGLEVEHIEDKAKALAPFTIARVISAEQHPNADRLRVCMVDTGDGSAPVQVVCGAPNARAGLRQRVLAARHLHSRQEHHARRRHHPRRREPRHAVFGGGVADLGRSRRHHGAAGGRADRCALRTMGRARRSHARDQPDTEPAGLHRRAWHRPRSCGCRHGQVQGSRHQAHQGRIPLSREGDGRGRQIMSGFCLASRARRQEWPVAGVAAEAADLDRLAADQRAGRYHQLHDLRPRPAAACVRRGQGEGQPDRAPRARRREPAGAGRPHLHARQRRMRDRGRARRRIARRHHGRRGLRLLGSNHRRPDRIGAVERDQHRADRPQARHQFRRPLPLRARRRSGLHGAGARDGDASGDGVVRRHAVGKRRGRQGLRRRSRDRFPADRGEAPRRHRRSASGDETHPRAVLAS